MFPDAEVVEVQLIGPIRGVVHNDLLRPLIVDGNDCAKSLLIPYSIQETGKADIVSHIQRVMREYQSNGTMWSYDAQGYLHVTQGALDISVAPYRHINTERFQRFLLNTVIPVKSVSVYAMNFVEGCSRSKELSADQVVKIQFFQSLPNLMLGMIQAQIQKIIDIAFDEAVVNVPKRIDLRQKRTTHNQSYESLEKNLKILLVVAMVSGVTFAGKGVRYANSDLQLVKNCQDAEKIRDGAISCLYKSFSCAAVSFCCFAASIFTSIKKADSINEIRNEELLLLNKSDARVIAAVSDLSKLLCHFLYADQVRAKCFALLNRVDVGVAIS